MPRDSAGNYTLPPGNPVASGEIISANWANTTMDDLGEALSASLDRYGRGGMLAPFSFADGTVSAPGATWANEPTTGFFRNGYGDLQVTITGQQMQKWTPNKSYLWRDDGEGNVGWDEILTASSTGGDITFDSLFIKNDLYVNTDQFVVDSVSGNSYFGSGNVGIGVAPLTGAPLTVKTPNSAFAIGEVEDEVLIGPTSTAKSLKLGNQVQSGTNTWMTIAADGNVGIGKEPTAPFDVDAGNNATLGRFETSATALARMYLYGGASTTQTDLAFLQGTDFQGVVGVAPDTGDLFLDSRSSAGGAISFQRTGTERMRIDSSGNVRIGSPLHGGGIQNLNLCDTAPEFVFKNNTVASSGDVLGKITALSCDASGVYDNRSGANIQFIATSSTNTYYQPTAITFSTNSSSSSDLTAERMRIDSSGNVGIGTTSPNNYSGWTTLTINGPTTGSEIDLEVAGTHIGSLYATSDTVGLQSTSGSDADVVFRTNSVEAMRIDTSGNVGIGNNNPSAPLQVTNTTSSGTAVFQHNGGNSYGTVLTLETTGGSDDPVLSFVNYNGGSPVYYGIAGTDDGSLAFKSGAGASGFGIERMRIDSSGNLTATGNITAYSDERLKSDVQTLDGSKVYEMRGVSFTKDGEDGSGVIAQELQKVAPELVNDSGEYLSVAYGNVVGYLIEAVKDLKAEIEELKRGQG